MEPENLKLDRYLLSLSTSARPKICFIGTASGDSERYLDKFYAAYQTLPCEPSHLSLFKPHTREIESFILSQEIIHIGEGNARNLLALWKEWGLDEILYKAYCKGIVISGVSAGMICWFEEGLTNSCGEGFEVLKGLGWIKGSAVPHYDGVVNREPSYESLLKQEMILPGLALENGVGALYVNEVLHTLVSSRDSASGYSYLEKGVLQERKAKYL
jgi:peptidase E